MNPEPQIPSVPEPDSRNTQHATRAPNPPASTDHPQSPFFATPRRKPTGKIANLPKAQRDIVNQMLDDGATYKSIEIEMATHGVSLNGENISNWFESGFQLYLQHQDRIAETRLLRENASDLVQDYNVIQFHQAANQLAVGQIFKSLTQQQLIDDPINFVRTLNALARLSRAALVLKQCEDQSAKALAETEKPQAQADLDTQRKLILSVMEHGFGCKAADDPIGFPPLNPNPNRNPGPPSPAAPESDQAAPSPIENRYGKTSLVSTIENPCSSGSPSSPLPSRPCRSEASEPGRITQHHSHSSQPSNLSSAPETRPSAPNNPSIQHSTNPAFEHCLDCGAPLPPVPPHSLRRPEDHCPSCGMRLPDIGLCYQPGFDRCLNCGATQPHLLPGGERPRPHCHKCGERLHNPEPS